MKFFVSGLRLMVSRTDSRRVFILSALSFCFIFIASQNWGNSISVFGLESLSLIQKITLFVQSFFDFSSAFTAGTLILGFTGSIIGAVNLSLAYTYIKTRGDMIVRSGLYSGLGLFFAFIGVGCAACGAAFVSLIFGFLGLSSTLELLPYKGEEIGYLGLSILIVATYSLAKKVAAPNVC